jgi:hypothetical protein
MNYPKNSRKQTGINQQKLILCFAFVFLFLFQKSQAAVVLRDSTVVWQHHRYSVNADYSMATMTNVDNDIVGVQFQGKVIENELFRIVLVPEFGGRILSYFYKPTAHEYLYQSPCGTPYGINQGNFYYNWLMVYGGIFPTFPEPEHGKTWLKPWQFNVVKTTADTVIVKMSMTDNTEYSGRPGQFNNGITGIVCDAEVGVYSGQTSFSFNVKLTNPSTQTKKYEYWTCTTLTPGSEMGKTFSPVNSEIIAPMDKYEAAWSTNNWIGKYGSIFDFSKINMLNEWTDMGIAYATTRSDDYWGVINHDKEEGFFRIADRNITKGMKLWTWGKDAVSANKFIISNGGKDDYIELWGGVGMHFFDDTLFPANSQLVSAENFFPTIGLNAISAMNKEGGASIDLNSNTGTNKFELKLNCFLTRINQDYSVDFYTNDNLTPVFTENIRTNSLGNIISKSLISSSFINGTNTLKAVLKNEKAEIVLVAQKQYNLTNTDVFNPNDNENVRIVCRDNHQLDFTVASKQTGQLSIYSCEGKIVYSGILVDGKQVELPNSGIYVVRMMLNNQIITQKVAVK